MVPEGRLELPCLSTQASHPRDLRVYQFHHPGVINKNYFHVSGFEFSPKLTMDTRTMTHLPGPKPAEGD